MNADLSSLPGWVIVLIVCLIVVELGLLIAAVVTLIKTDVARLTLPRIAWVLIIALVSIFGPIAFFIAGRKRSGDAVDVAGASHTSAKSAIDSLYDKP